MSVEWSDRRLSTELPHPRQLGVCQACGRTEDPREELRLQRWIECDDADQPTETLVVLCQGCAARIVEPHERLYKPVPRYRPILGAMAICIGCAHHADLRCSSPLRRRNGGPGFNVRCPPIGTIFACARKRSNSRHFTIHTGPATACEGREEA